MSHARAGRDLGRVEPRSSAAPEPRQHTTLARLVGALGLLLLTAVLYWLLTDDAFTVTDERVSFAGLRHADEAEVRALLSDIDRGPNVFRLRASDIVSQLSTLTEVDAASARITLPADVSVVLDERDPVFIWSDGDTAWLVDEEGMLFAPADVGDETAGEGSGPAPGAARERLPTIEDARLPLEPPTVGSHLPAIDLAAMRQLLAVGPELLGRRGSNLELRVDEVDGYVLESRDRAWRALFGHYTLTVHPPDLIPRQVQCLRWLLESDLRRLETVRLAVAGDDCGTYTQFDEQAAGSG